LSDDALPRRPISVGQWLAARALSEGAPPTRRRVAALLGCDDSAVYARAALEAWRTPDFRRPVSQAAHRHFMDVVYGDATFEGAADGDGAQPGAFDPDWAEDDGVARVVFARVVDGQQAAVAAEPGEAESDDPAEMLSRGARFLSRRLSRLMRQAERGGQISKQEIDNLTAMTRMMDRWETLAKERAKQEETKSDEDLAETLRIIDDRIVELAHEEALRLVAAGIGRKKRAKGKG
jgi:hypothetical protein